MKNILTLAFLFCLLFAACTMDVERKGQENATQETGNAGNNSAAAQNNNGEYVFKGQLNGRDLLLKVLFEDSKADGGYYFVDEGKERKISGSLSDDNNAAVIEYDEKNNPVGLIKRISFKEGVFELVYSQPDGSNPVPFTLNMVEDAAAYKPN